MRLKDENQRFLSDNVALQRQGERQNDDKDVVLRQREAELQKNRELSAAVYDLEARIRAKDDQIIGLRKDIDQLRFSNASIVDRNDEYMAELEALNQHVQLLDSQNKGLNRELEQFVETDEEIRVRLNRRDRVTEMRQRTEYELRRSMADLDRASPVRRGRVWKSILKPSDLYLACLEIWYNLP